MKKILAFLLAAVMLFALCACGSNDKKEDEKTPATTTKAPEDNDTTPANVKFGAGLHAFVEIKEAGTGKGGKVTDASGALEIATAAVLVDKDGKIVAYELDAINMKTSISADGKVTPVSDLTLKTKYEQGAEYGMVGRSEIGKEWFEQADAFKALVIGKTLDEVKALMVADGDKAGYGVDSVQAAGCTISISEMVLALEDAYKNATVEVAADAKLALTASNGQAAKDKSDAVKNGNNKLTANIFGAAVDANGKILAAASDCMEVTFTMGDDGKITADKADGLSKRQQGNDYGMVAYAGSAKEWYAQADAFDAACVGKTAAEIAGLMGEDYKGIDSLKAAGCTIYVSGFVAAASKI